MAYLGSYSDTPLQTTYRRNWIVRHIGLGEEDEARMKGWVGWRVEDGFEEDECAPPHTWHIITRCNGHFTHTLTP